MIRSAYRGLFWLHPAEFEERFAEEMLWIFDLKRSGEIGIALLLDCFVSFCKQWLAYPPVRTFATGFVGEWDARALFRRCASTCERGRHRRP